MSAEIIELSEIRAQRAGGLASQSRKDADAASEMSPRFHFWTGASGRRYVHTVYSIFDCPPLGLASYVLVRRLNRNERSVLAIGRLVDEQATLNLAEIRHRAATLGADEVHVHLLAASPKECQDVEADLLSAEFAQRIG